MTRLRIAAALLAISAIAAGGCTRTSSGPESSPGTSEIHPEVAAKVTSPRAFAIVELFSSEGCSSCPPAEQLLGELLGEARAQGTNILYLGFHVNYWDGLGWKDPYSSAAFTQRQRMYADRWGKSGLYTPQAVVGGRYEMLGSYEAKLRAAIEVSLSRETYTTVEVKLGEATADHVEVDFTIDGAPADALLDLALVERDLRDVPDRGENEGTPIGLQNVVRTFETVAATTKGHATLRVPPGVRHAHASVVAYVQKRDDLVIVGGTSVDLVP